MCKQRRSIAEFGSWGLGKGDFKQCYHEAWERRHSHCLYRSCLPNIVVKAAICLLIREWFLYILVFISLRVKFPCIFNQKKTYLFCWRKFIVIYYTILSVDSYYIGVGIFVKGKGKWENVRARLIQTLKKTFKSVLHRYLKIEYEEVLWVNCMG